MQPENDFDKLIWKFIYKENISMNDISLYLADTLLSTIRHRDIYLFTPIIIYYIDRSDLPSKVGWFKKVCISTF